MVPSTLDDESIFKVIVAEDHPAMRSLIAKSLRRVGFDVVEVSDGAVLWRELQDSLKDDDNPRDADLIITDVRMPECSGIEVLSLIRQANRGLPVIVMTAFGDHALHAEANRLGAARVFDKPFDIRDLVAEALRLFPHP